MGLADSVRGRCPARDFRRGDAAQAARDRGVRSRQEDRKPSGSIRAILKYPRELLLVVGLTAGGTAAFYTFTTYMQTFVKLSVGLTEDQTTFVIFGSLIFATLLQPIYGALSDRIGRKPVLIFFVVVVTLATVPILTELKA